METRTQHPEAVETPVPIQFRKTSSPEHAIFRKEGEYWTLGYGDKSFRLKDTKGLGYLAHLLRHPGVEFHVLDLAGGIARQQEKYEASSWTRGLPRGAEDLEKAGIHIGSLGDAGEMLDEQAKVAYKRRLSELREELEEAKEVGNIERAEHAEREIDALTRELSRAVGLGGRSRRAASASERARQSITKTIKSVVERIGQSDARLGDVFSRCVKTGNYCCYKPDPNCQIAWEFSAPTIEPSDPTSSGEPAPAHAGRPQVSAVMLDVSPFPLVERTAFVGRESEVRAIRAIIDRALGGHGSVVMLGGGPGVGKTRLATEMSEYASRVAFRCVVGHCYERDEPFPYRPWENVRLIINRRLERFDENEKRVLAAAAVIGRSFNFQLLTAISQIDVDELFTVIEKAQQIGIIIPSSEGPERPFTFTHELVRQTLLAGPAKCTRGTRRTLSILTTVYLTRKQVS
jgi:hypothetical protein